MQVGMHALQEWSQQVSNEAAITETLSHSQDTAVLIRDLHSVIELRFEIWNTGAIDVCV